MIQVDFDSWGAFEAVVRINIEIEKLFNVSGQTCTSITDIIYRGQADSEWSLESTLERRVRRNITVDSYFDMMLNLSRLRQGLFCISA